MRWAVDHGADVINMSLTRNTLEWPESWDDAFLYAMEHDVVIVAAAGNRGSGTTEVGAPATMPGVLTVAGVDRNGKASFDASSQGITISVAAPSEDLVGAAPGGGYYNWAGTSGATPIVAGLVALVRSALSRPGCRQRHQPRHRDREPGRRPGAQPDLRVRADRRGRGGDRAGGPVTANPMGDLKDWIRVYRRAPRHRRRPRRPSTPPRTTPSPVPSARAANPLGTLLPTVASLRDIGIPLLVFAVFGTLLALLVRVFYRRIRAPPGQVVD